jgi:hypothetical protein
MSASERSERAVHADERPEAAMSAAFLIQLFARSGRAERDPTQ